MLAFLVVLAVALTSCGGTPTKTSTTYAKQETSSASVEEVLYNQGQTFWQAWEEKNNTGDLQLANGLFKKAWEKAPENLNYQHAYYLSSVYLGFYTEGTREEDLLPLYKQLAPSVKAEVPPPARMAYAIGNFKSQAPEKLIPLAQRAIKQKPQDALSWKQLSEQYVRLQQYQLAAAAAHKAYVKDSQVSDYAWQLGASLGELAVDLRCEQKDELQRSAYYTARAAALQKDNAEWYAESAQRYIELGLLPLAHHQMQKSINLEANASYITAYIYTSIIEGSAFQTSEFIAEAEQVQHTHESFKALAMAAATMGEWNNARDFMNLAREQDPLDVYDQLIYSWLEKLAKGAKSSTTQPWATNNNLDEEQQALVDFVQGAHADNELLIKKLKPSNACSKQKVDFYTALKNWQLGNRNATVKHLQSAAQSTHFFAREKVWAAAFLQGMNLKK